MATHPYFQLAPVYAGWWEHLTVKADRQKEAMDSGRRLLLNRSVYEDLQGETHVPALWTMCTNYRESGGRLNTYLGNGDPLGQRTRDVPRNRGPFTGPHAWVDGAKDAFGVDGIDKVNDWSMTRAIFEWILWNGWGYDAHGVRSPYAVGGTTLQQSGRYAGDGNWQPGQWDTQLGCMAVAWAILQQAPELALPFPEGAGTPAPQVDADGNIATPHGPPPITVGGSEHDARWLQAALNHVHEIDTAFQRAVDEEGGPPSLQVDGDVGRRTRLYVRAYEKTKGLTVDRGFPGPQVLGSLDMTLGPDWHPAAS